MANCKTVCRVGADSGEKNEERKWKSDHSYARSVENGFAGTCLDSDLDSERSSEGKE